MDSGDPSLTKPGVPLVCKEAVGEKVADRSKSWRVLAVVRVVVLKHVADVNRVGQNHDAAVRHSEVDDLSKFADRAVEQADRVATHQGQAAEETMCSRPRWVSGHGK